MKHTSARLNINPNSQGASTEKKWGRGGRKYIFVCKQKTLYIYSEHA